mgnify:CR=1 FL=1
MPDVERIAPVGSPPQRTPGRPARKPRGPVPADPEAANGPEAPAEAGADAAREEPSGKRLDIRV